MNTHSPEVVDLVEAAPKSKKQLRQQNRVRNHIASILSKTIDSEDEITRYAESWIIGAKPNKRPPISIPKDLLVSYKVNSKDMGLLQEELRQFGLSAEVEKKDYYEHEHHDDRFIVTRLALDQVVEPPTLIGE